MQIRAESEVIIIDDRPEAPARVGSRAEIDRAGQGGAGHSELREIKLLDFARVDCILRYKCKGDAGHTCLNADNIPEETFFSDDDLCGCPSDPDHECVSIELTPGTPEAAIVDFIKFVRSLKRGETVVVPERVRAGLRGFMTR